jgi:hypothetical protein
MDIIVAVIKSASVIELSTGVIDLSKHRRLKVDLALMKSLRDAHWNDFRDTVVDALDFHCPGYKDARQRGERIRIDPSNEAAYTAVLRSKEFKGFLAGAIFQRALLATGLPARKPSDKEYTVAEPKIRCYVDAYVEYIIRCATEYTPQPNDLGDSECFMYLQGSNCFLSSDKRWVRIARAVCPDHFFDPENKIPA